MELTEGSLTKSYDFGLSHEQKEKLDAVMNDILPGVIQDTFQDFF